MGLALTLLLHLRCPHRGSALPLSSPSLSALGLRVAPLLVPSSSNHGAKIGRIFIASKFFAVIRAKNGCDKERFRADPRWRPLKRGFGFSLNYRLRAQLTTPNACSSKITFPAEQNIFLPLTKHNFFRRGAARPLNALFAAPCGIGALACTGVPTRAETRAYLRGKSAIGCREALRRKQIRLVR